jgi:hypothetical protein
MRSSPLAVASACIARRSASRTTLAGQRVGIKEIDDGIWIVSFMHYDLGYIDLEQKTLQPLDNPCYPCLRYGLLPMSPIRTFVYLARPAGFEPTTPWFVALDLNNQVLVF